MHINLNNYESFFLMYVDNELPAADRILVEAFIEQYPYLKQELVLLQQMVLPASDAVVFDKKNLYRSAAAEETLPEALLLHLDNELAGTAKDTLLQQLQNDNKLQDSLAQLQKTKLDAGEIISFPDKKILYKTGSGRLVTGSFVRWAVAAALIAAGIFVGVSLIKNEGSKKIEVSKNDVQKNSNIDTAAINNANNTLAKENDVPKPAVQDALPGKKLLAADTNLPNNATVKSNKVQQKALKEIPQKQIAIAKIASVVQSKKQFTTSDKNQEPDNTIIATNDKTNLKIQESSNTKTLTASVTNKQKPESLNVPEDKNIDPVQNSFAKTSLLQNEENNDNRIFLIDEENVSKSKAGAFFKKLKRTVARNTKIKTGNSLKIAGFEFAVK